MLFDKIQDDLKQAQLDRDEIGVSTLRLLISEIHNVEIQKGPPAGGLSEEEIISVIQREVKKRKEGALGFRQGGREEQAQKEESEQKVLEGYLPEQLSNEELTKIVESSISEACQLALVNGSEKPSLQDMGKIIRLIMEKVKGRAEGGTISALVK